MSRYAPGRFAVALFLAGTAPAFAETKGPAISGEIAIEMQNDWAYRADDRNNLNNNLFPKIEPSATLALAPEWSVFGHAVMEPIGAAGKFENRAFKDLGLVMEDLYIEHRGERFGARAGKLNPGFGIAWDRAPGIYGDEFPKGYEINERIGLVGSYKLPRGAAGETTVSASTFFLDTSVLSQSALAGRGDTRRGDGGVSNTERFNSFLGALDGGNVPGAGGLGYHLSYMHQARGSGDARDEDSVAVGLHSSFDLGHGVTFLPLAEYVHRQNFAGVADQDRNYVTLAGEFGWNAWNLAVAWTGRDTVRKNAADDRDSQLQISGGYTFDIGLTLEIGWKVTDEADSETQTLGAKASYTIPF